VLSSWADRNIQAYTKPNNVDLAADYLGAGVSPIGAIGKIVYHGSPHKFSKFDMSKIGTGEGAQAYGHGLYMAESPDVAKQYQKQLSNDGFMVGDKVFNPSTLQHLNIRTMAARGDLDGAIEKARQIAGSDSPVASMAMQDLTQLESIKRLGGFKQNQGAFYKVDIPDEAIPRMLDWDKPLSEQNIPDSVFAALPVDPRKVSWMNADGKTLVEGLQNAVGKEQAQQFLQQSGIPGIRYLDGSSRNVGEGTSNFVLFDDQLPRILEINGQPTGLLSYADEAKKAQSGLLDNAPTPKDYGITHRPPMRDSGAPLHDLTGGGTVYPDDIYSSKATQYYGTGDTALDRKTMRLIQNYKDNPDAPVVIYRAVSKEIPENAKINAGDWVTINPDYAKMHGESTLNGEYRIIKQQVKAKDIYTNGDSIHEFGFDPD
jgi:hypothetical protein